MALDTNGLKAELKKIFETNGNTAESVAAAMASAIESFVKSGTVTVKAGISVAVVPTSGKGATDGTGTGSIS